MKAQSIVLLIVSTMLVIVSLALITGPNEYPYCQEDEVILFNLPERDTLWCQHIDTLPSIFTTLQIKDTNTP